ncbi:FitA-like ribbon-helix-helix domain-containing protein [Leptospira haakeii]|uniref:Antitoxin n=1 Tax=Leptospira haakeii TaxID=2023198 RepID=A0ABX4PRF9_9LEPT|nr:antitoxin [Leptospira haakeii]PKA16978.1 antitoxin [Leptospira haakeii]PKA20036.1 antitoxin [Leptospira haakeii]
MANLQVRDIDDRLYEALKRRAEMEHRSVSQEVVLLIENYLAHDNKESERKTLDFLELSGSWVDERSADKIAKDIRSSRTKNTLGKDADELFD